jgi:hypothetical protein
VFAWIPIVWNLISGNIPGIIKGVTDTIGKISDNETTRLTAELQSYSAAWQARVDLLKGLKVTQWLLVAALFPPLLHQGMIFLDSTPFPYIWFDTFWPAFHMHDIGSWKVPQAPGAYHEREWLMIASLLGIQTGVGIASAILKLVRR